MDSSLVDNIEIDNSLFEDNFVIGESDHSQNNPKLAHINNFDFAITGSKNGRPDTVVSFPSRQQSNISSISSHQGIGHIHPETDLEEGLRRFTIHKDVQKASAYYAKMHYSEEKDETIKCIFSSILFVIIVCLVLVYMFVRNPQV